MSNPLQLVVLYDDGTQRTIDFSKISIEVRLELAELGLCPPSISIGTSKQYVLLEWDGWKEVIGIDHESVELLRYYVIRRIEDRGRLSLNVGTEDPELYIIKRLPKELQRIVVTGSTGAKTYDLSSDIESWEGIFEAGGKIEFTKYDKTFPYSDQAQNDPENSVTRLLDALNRELAEVGLDPALLIASDERVRIEAYRQIATKMGIRGKVKQEDVYGFIDFLIRNKVFQSSDEQRK